MNEEVKNENLDNVEEGQVVELEETPQPENEDVAETVSDVESTEEVAEKPEEDELAGYSDKVQKRINSLTRKLREAERASESAFNMANNLKNENDVLKKSATGNQQYAINEKEGRLESQKVQAQSALKQALIDQDHDKIVKAQDILSQLAVEESNVRNTKQKLQEENIAIQQPVRETQQTPQQQPDPKAQAWAEKNEWFGEDRVMTMATFGIHEDLVDQGFDPNSNEYYTEVDKRLRNEFPTKFQSEDGTGTETQKPQQKVASAARNTQGSGGKRKVKLSPSEVQMAKKLNVPLNEYAKFVKR
tara:strand:+ start:2845 stop:3753 length:909 start_codon:yes stop_codon:yes gene_type:complete